MSNTLSPTVKPPISIDFKRGDIVNALGQIGVIVDVLRSTETNNICLYVRFVHNLGNARSYDMLELSPERMLGVDKWTLATHEDLEQAIAKRRIRLDQEIDELLKVFREDSNDVFMSNYTQGEQTDLRKTARRLIQLRDFLDNTDFEQATNVTQWFEYLSRIKAIQGNLNNDISFIACLMVKNYLAQRFNIGNFDMSAKPQGAPGLDIDLRTTNGERIIGEIKTTVPYSGAKNDLGAKQKENFKHDFDKLNKTSANHKFFFVTDRATFEVIHRKYASQIPEVKVVLLTSLAIHE